MIYSVGRCRLISQILIWRASRFIARGNSARAGADHGPLPGGEDADLERSVAASPLGDRCGFAKGDTFAIFMPNVPEYVVAFHGAVRPAAAARGRTPEHTARELGRQLVDSRVKLRRRCRRSSTSPGRPPCRPVTARCSCWARPCTFLFSELPATRCGTVGGVRPGNDIAASVFERHDRAEEGSDARDGNLVADMVQCEALFALFPATW